MKIFFCFQGNLVFQIIEQAELNRAFLQDMASRAELFCPKAQAKTEPSRASARTQHYKIRTYNAGGYVQGAEFITKVI